MIKGKFHSAVPDVIKNSYEIVERLIAYSYFHYPMIEEAISKMTRVFEMSVKIRAKSLGIVYNNLSNCLNKLKDHPDIEPEMTTEWLRFKGTRNYYAHPESQSFSGPAPLQMLYPMLNTINSLFAQNKLFVGPKDKLAELQHKLIWYSDGISIFEIGDIKHLIIGARPFFLSPDLKKSIWYLTPVYNDFPQTMEDFDFLLNPIIIRLTDLNLNTEMIVGKEFFNKAKIRIYSTDIKGNMLAAKSYINKLESADETVKSFHKSNSLYMEYFEKQKFIYDEYWNF